MPQQYYGGAPLPLNKAGRPKYYPSNVHSNLAANLKRNVDDPLQGKSLFQFAKEFDLTTGKLTKEQAEIFKGVNLKGLPKKSSADVRQKIGEVQEAARKAFPPKRPGGPGYRPNIDELYDTTVANATKVTGKKTPGGVAYGHGPGGQHAPTVVNATPSGGPTPGTPSAATTGATTTTATTTSPTSAPPKATTPPKVKLPSFREIGEDIRKLVAEPFLRAEAAMRDIEYANLGEINPKKIAEINKLSSMEEAKSYKPVEKHREMRGSPAYKEPRMKLGVRRRDALFTQARNVVGDIGRSIYHGKSATVDGLLGAAKKTGYGVGKGALGTSRFLTKFAFGSRGRAIGIFGIAGAAYAAGSEINARVNNTDPFGGRTPAALATSGTVGGTLGAIGGAVAGGIVGGILSMGSKSTAGRAVATVGLAAVGGYMGGYMGAGAGLTGMKALAERDETTNMAGRDFIRAAHAAQGRVDAPMSFGGNSRGTSLQGMNMGASGNLALSMSTLRRGR